MPLPGGEPAGILPDRYVRFTLLLPFLYRCDTHLLFKWIQDRHSHARHVLNVPRDKLHAVNTGGGGDLRIRKRH